MDKKLLVLIGIFFLAFTTFVSVVIFDQNDKIIRANIQEPVKLLVFAVPSRARTADKIEITAAVNDEDDRPIKSIEVCSTTTFGSLNLPCTLTNDSGIATFTLSSSAIGTATITTTVSSLQQNVTAEFYE